MREIEGDSPVPEPSPKGRKITAEEHRLNALGFALTGPYTSNTADAVIVRAKMFEEYLKNGA